ncbi:MAG: acyl-CoA desaturase [Dehalococcoidia bacterium]|nr:acyl-CoA desaturase [Dehalococcoidia bacterium]
MAVFTAQREGNARPAPAVDYVVLKRRIKEAGLMEPRPAYYWLKTAIAIGTLGLAITLALVVENPWLLMLDAVFMGFASTQIALLAHDVGHRQGYRGRRTNRIARSMFGNLLLCVSHSWWNDKHNQHHASPNHIDKDPDIQFPMIVFAAEQIESRSRLLRPLIAIQAFLLLFLLPFQALNMRIISVQHLFSPKAERPWLQAALLLAHLAGYAMLLFFIGLPWAIPFAVVHQLTFGLYNSSVFASNHKGMPLTADGRRMDFFREQVLTSRNVTGRRLTDFWYGGLNYQIEHHLFPTMPRCNLSKAQPIVEAFCAEQGVSYHSTGLFASYREILAHLHRESASLRGGREAARAI